MPASRDLGGEWSAKAWNDDVPQQTDALINLHQRLRSSGQRLTPQRVLILELLYAHGDHASAEELFDAAQERYPYINISTVYRTLEVLRDLGIVSETDLGDGVRQFALLTENRHHHLICLGCGHVDNVDDALFEDLRINLRESKQFEPRIDHLAIFGMCAACAPR
jgi:Fur family ferric uptake transcriptional regulator